MPSTNDCILDECHDYTIHTFDLYLTERDVAGNVGTDELVGNIVTGGLDDDVEFFPAFDPLGREPEPIQVGIRNSLALSFTVDAITCANLRRALSADPVLAAGADRIGFDAVFRSKVYRATLEHTMPNGTLITVRFHRSTITTPLSWLFSPNSPHAIALTIVSLPDDAESNPFGYLEITPAECASS